jgi:DNA-binding transcriptional MerR regulator
MTGSIPPSQAAEQSGFSLDTLRYYERIGLLDDIGRAPSGRRRFREPTMTERLTLLIEHDGRVRRRIAALQAERAHLQEKIGWYRSRLQADDAR